MKRKQSLDGADLCMRATRGDRVNGLPRILDVFALSVGQSGRLLMQNPLHQAEPGQDRAAQKLALGG